MCLLLALFAAAPVAPKKPNPKPAVPMKPFFWSVVPPIDLGATIFADMDDGKAKINKGELEKLFCNAPKKAPAADGPGAGAGAGGAGGPGSPARPGTAAAPAKKEEVTLIDPKRSYGINIALARFKMPFPSIRDALLGMDERALDEEKIASLVAIAPTAEESETMDSYDGPLADLGMTEQFFMAMKQVPFLQERLALFLYKKRFDSALGEVAGQIDLLENALTALRTSKNLKSVLEHILAIGNYANGGTAKGGAYGFKLDTLGKLRNTKSTSEAWLTLLHFLVQSLKASQPSVHEGLKIDLAAVHAAARTEIASVLTDVNKLQASARKLRKALDGVPESGRSGSSPDRFYKVMSEFYDRSNILVESVGERAKKVEKGAAEALRLFGEEGNKSASLDSLLTVFDQFIDEYKKAEQEITHRAELAEKAKKNEMEKEKREREKEEKRIRATVGAATAGPSSGSAGAGGAPGADLSKVVDATLNALSSANASDLAAAVRAKRAQAADRIAAHKSNQQTLKPGQPMAMGMAMQMQMQGSGKFPSLNRFGTKILP